MSQPQESVATCRNCGGTASRRAGNSPPLGWYGLTVSVPEWYTEDSGGEPYVWVGLFCKSACLAAYGPDLARMEGLAREAYDAVVPVPAANNSGHRRGPRP